MAGLGGFLHPFLLAEWAELQPRPQGQEAVSCCVHSPGSVPLWLVEFFPESKYDLLFPLYKMTLLPTPFYGAGSEREILSLKREEN